MISSPLIIELPKLKKVVSKSNVRRLLRTLNESDRLDFSILGLTGCVLFGEVSQSSEHRTEIEIEGECLGYVLSDRPMPEVAALLVYCIRQDAQEKGLANEALSKYEEINFLYDLSKTLMLCRTIPEVVQIAMYESRKLISATGGSIVLFNAEQNILETVASWGDVPQALQPMPLGTGIQGSIFSTGKAEIVNNVPEDIRYVPASPSVQSLMCAPLVSRQGTLGIVNLFHSRPFFYTANELKLLVMLAEQTGMVLENLMLQAARPLVSPSPQGELQQRLIQIQAQLEQMAEPHVSEGADSTSAASDVTRQLMQMTEVNRSLVQALQQSLGIQDADS